MAVRWGRHSMPIPRRCCSSSIKQGGTLLCRHLRSPHHQSVICYSNDGQQKNY